ncbi:MAG: hypothetical protein ACM3Q1_02650 [Bacteroidales bacterium]
MTTEPEVDVLDQAALAQYRQKRAEWLHLLNDDEHHAIWSQITNMIWDDASFRILNEARNPALSPNGSSARNALLANIIDRGYVLGQVIALRKLVEKNPSDRKKGVVTLRRLLDDLRLHRHLFTREIYVTHDGLPYDYEEVERQWWERRFKSGETGLTSLPTSGPGAFDFSRMAHERFDKLSGVEPQNRSRTDCISESVFDTLDRWIKESGASDIIIMGNKFLAHAADSVSRASVSLDRFGLTMDQIAAAHRAFVRVAQAISVSILDDSCHVGVVAVPQYDHFENLDLPYVDPAAIPALRQHWDAYSVERDGWLDGVVDELVGKPTMLPPGIDK